MSQFETYPTFESQLEPNGGAWMVTAGQGIATPRLFAASPQTARRFWEFFTAEIPNDNTRKAYFCAIRRFDAWCAVRNLPLLRLQPILIAAYIKELQAGLSVPSVKQHLAAIRMLFDYLVVGQALPMNPAASVRGPKYAVKKGKTPVLSAGEARQLIESIETTTVKGLRDRALLAVMVYTFARVGAVIAMPGEDYFQQGKRRWFRFHEKGGKRHEVPAHHKAEAHVDAWIAAAGIAGQPKLPLFRTFGRKGEVTAHPLYEADVLRVVKRRGKAIGLPPSTCCHTFRATGITAYLENGGTLEKAQAIAAHASPRTTKLYDRTSDVLTLEEIEKIGI
jgi:site-specific recombinase XerD